MESEYDRKFEEMKKYIPFLESMIKRLESTSSASANPRQAQLDKIRSLRDLLLDQKKRMKMENLLKCEQVLVNLYAKVEQRDTQNSPHSTSTASTTKLAEANDLEKVRNKLKSVVNINRDESQDTLPEIARANIVEETCTPGSKEPALFQRRPNKTSLSPVRNLQKSPIKSASSTSKRNYTRVLLSPEPEKDKSRRWENNEKSEKPLFSRRSPRRSPKRSSPTYNKKERKKSKKGKDLNITLNVPEESLNSLNSKDILSRIMNCNDSDVDIETLREAKRQILNELKQTGAKCDDISDLLLKSYKKSSKSGKSGKMKDDVEEGEISDSESEAISSIYDNFILDDGNVNSAKGNDSNTQEKPRKIQICLVINSDKDAVASDTHNDTPNVPQDATVDDFEMYDKNSSSIIKDTLQNSELKNICNQKENSSESVGKENKKDETKPVSESSATSTDQVIKCNDSEEKNKPEHLTEVPTDVSTEATQPANFYKPLKDDKHISTAPTNENSLEIKETVIDKNTCQSEKGGSNLSSRTEALPEIAAYLKSTENEDKEVEIPLLHDQSVATQKPKESVVSEIDILQALKKEILGEPISIPESETTPLMHQPKLTKVASVQEIGPKKRISIEKYKKKSASSVSSSTSLFINDPMLLLNDDSSMSSREDNTKKQSLKLTEKECERFNFPTKLALDDDDDLSDEDLESDFCLNDIYGNLAPKSPDHKEEPNTKNVAPVIIPADPIKTVTPSKLDVDMRTLTPNIISPSSREIKQDKSVNKLANVHVDPRMRRDLNKSTDKDHSALPRPVPPVSYPTVVPNATTTINASMTPKRSPLLMNPIMHPNMTPNRVPNMTPNRVPNMTPSMAPNMTPSMAPNMTPSMVPNMTPSRNPNMTPNSRNFDMLNPQLELDDTSSRKHVYAPMFPLYDQGDSRERSVVREQERRSHWDHREIEKEQRIRDSRWGDISEIRDGNLIRDPRATSVHRETPDYSQSRNNYDNYSSRLNERRDNYSRSECPRTPVHSFGRSDAPMTPIHAFGRSDCPQTPSHPFGLSDCPLTPSHPFGRSDCPPTPSHSFGRPDFSRNDGSMTPSHSFGRIDMPLTPSHPFGRSESQLRDPRLNRISDQDNYQKDDADRMHYMDRKRSSYNNSYRSESNTVDSYRNHRERSVGRNERSSYSEHDSYNNKDQRYRRDSSDSRVMSRDFDSDRSHPRDLGHGFQGNESHRKNDNYDSRKGFIRERSVGRGMPDSRMHSSTPRRFDDDRALSIGRSKVDTDNRLRVKPDTGSSFMIDTSVRSTFQDFMRDKKIPEFENTFNDRRRRASSVGRTLCRESSVGRTLCRESSVGRLLPKQQNSLCNTAEYSDRNPKQSHFRRARSVGREILTSEKERSFKDLKEDFRNFSKQNNHFKWFQKSDTEHLKSHDKSSIMVSVNNTKKVVTEKANTELGNKKPYSPRKNSRDPRMRRDLQFSKNKHKYENTRERESKTIGIVYSNDNITKGTILGSGYGVKNYKIPKIKRPVEVETKKEESSKEDVKEEKDSKKKEEKATKKKEEKDTKKKEEKDTKKKVEKYVESGAKKNIAGEDKSKNTKNKVSRVDKTELTSETGIKAALRSDEEPTEKRVTRLSKKSESSSPSLNDNVSKIKRTKKQLIIDSDSDSDQPEPENKEPIKPATPLETSCTEKGQSEQVTGSARDKEKLGHNDDKKQDIECLETKLVPSNSKETDVSDESFGIDDLESFSDNLASDPVIDNINALIADLDNDLGPTKLETNDKKIVDSFKDIRNVNEDVEKASRVASESPKKINTLKKNVEINESSDSKIREVNTLEGSQASELDHLKTGTLLQCTPVSNDNTVSSRVSSESPKKNNTLKENVEINESSDSKIKEVNTLEGPPASELDHSKTGSISNDNTVSTTDSNKEKISENKENEKELATQTSSLPDSTNEFSKNPDLDDSLPDSTNEAQTDINSLVTSSHDVNKDNLEPCSSNKEMTSDNSIDNILSILKNKSKLKEIFSMLGDQSGENEKIKKKLEKLCAIVSDEEDDAAEDQVEKSTLNTSGNSSNKDNEIEIKLSKNDCPEVKIDSSNDIILEKSGENKGTTETVSKNSDDLDKEQNILEEEMETKAPKKQLVKRGQMTKKGRGRPATTARGAKRITRSAITKVKKPSRELLMLQEDLKEMFISDDVLNATGIRMCRIAKLVDDNSHQLQQQQSSKEDLSSSEPGPVVVLEKFKDMEALNEVPLVAKTMRKKPGPKPKLKPEEPIENFNKSTKMKPLKYKPGPKSKTKQVQKSDDEDPYAFETDSISENNESIKSLDHKENQSSDSENDSLSSSQSFKSTDLLVELKKKPKRKRSSWQSGVIKPKNRKKKSERKQSETLTNQPTNEDVLAPQTSAVIPDPNCFTDKSYCFHKNSLTYSCRLCIYSGEDIVNHYKQQHPHSEIPLSRLSPDMANAAIQECEVINFQAVSKIPSDKYVCRFCFKEFGGKSAWKKNILEEFFWHVVSMHTGEYKHSCSCINVKNCPFNLDIPPPPKDVKGQLIGYICEKCNFTQISLENLKTHVIVRHNDEQTEVYTINLAVLTRHEISECFSSVLKKRSPADPKPQSPVVPRVLRSRSNLSATEASDDQSDLTDTDNPSESTNLPKESELSPNVEKKTNSNLLSKITFENEDSSTEASNSLENDETAVKEEPIEEDIAKNKEIEVLKNNLISELCGTEDSGTTATNINEASEATNIPTPADINDCAHFKISFTESGSKEYVCCVNGVDNHYRTALLISMKKHVQLKHAEVWDGYCVLCKVIVTPQGRHKFKDCLQHYLDKHMDNFPVLEKIATQTEENQSAGPTEVQPSSPKPYINVRPLSELISKEVEIPPVAVEISNLPKIENVMSLGAQAVEPSQASPSYPPIQPPKEDKKVYKYEEVQAEVMSKKHRVVLDTMMSPAKLVNIFKCAGRFCSFTSDSAEEALVHASTHKRVGGENSLICAYCDFDCSENAIDLVMHVFKAHGHGACPFSCGYCFYRAAASQLVAAHAGRIHVDAPLRVLANAKVSAPPPIEDAAMLPREVVVQYYVCPHACKFKAYTAGKFVEHLLAQHAAELSHPCYLCKESTLTPQQLVQHMKSHQLNVYQCTWCVHGADTETGLLLHAAHAHPARQPQAYLRVIQRLQKDGTQQLRVLPLVSFNKSKMKVEPIAPATIGENAVREAEREAERSIELEKLIGHTTQLIDAVVPTPEVVTQPPTETESAVTSITAETEIVADTIPSSVTPVAAVIDPASVAVPQPPTTPPPPAQEKSEQVTPKIKSEPTEGTAKSLPSEVVCLDSDDDSRDSRDTSFNVIALSDEEAAETPTKDKDKESNYKTLPSVTLFRCPVCLSCCKTVGAFKRHTNTCFPFDGVWICPHCGLHRPTRDALIGHYYHDHSGEKRLHFCKLCDFRGVSLASARSHMKTLHNVHRVVVGRRKVPGADDEFVVEPVPASLYAAGSHNCKLCDFRGSANSVKNHLKNLHRVTKIVTERVEGDDTEYAMGPAEPSASATKRKRSSGSALEPPAKLKRFGPGDVDKLPINPIMDESVSCTLCEFSTKVRVNMVRHLQLHAEQQPVPQTAPVNPVPHLETNEMHFDRMVNLASSSIVTRAPEKNIRQDTATVSLLIPPEAASRYPKYVPDRQRHTCGAKGCSYISVDEAMLRCHWETLHSGSNDFHCVHCPPYQHLDTSKPLTAARIIAHLKMHDATLYACSSCVYYHYKKQMLDKHLSEVHKGSGRVMVVREEVIPSTPGPSSAVGAPTMDLKPWQCGLCSYKSMLRPDVAEHCSKSHQSKMQFKCFYCPFRTSALENVTKHQTNNHPKKPPEVFYYYYREGSIPDEVDGIPRWMKQRQKFSSTDPEVKSETTDPSEAPSTPQSLHQMLSTPSKPPAPPVDLNIVKKEVEDPSAELSVELLVAKFGQVCEPNGLSFKCPLCKVITEDTKEAMQSHLYEELKYRKWVCGKCSYKAFHLAGLNKHIESEHRGLNQELIQLPLDKNIEKWVDHILQYQSTAIEKNRENFSKQKIITERPPSTSISVEKTTVTQDVGADKFSMKELEQAFGPFGVPSNMMFCCPKCSFKVKDEAAMRDHLEMELTKIRWCCSNCADKFQTYHEAQFHCKSVHAGLSARPAEAPRAPPARAAWARAALHVQRLTMNCQPVTEGAPPLLAPPAPPPPDDLLVPRYEEPVTPVAPPPGPRKRPADKTYGAGGGACRLCPFTTRYDSALRDHMCRHYKLKPFSCVMCDYNGYRAAVYAHLAKQHGCKPLPEFIRRTPLPDHPPPQNTEEPVSGAKKDLSCDRCSERFKLLKDLKSHHESTHGLTPLLYSVIPHETTVLDSDDEVEAVAPKRVARKSTTKLPNRTVARKSTTKLPYDAPYEPEEYSYYGTEPPSYDEYENVTTLMTFCNTLVPFTVKKLSEVINIKPTVRVEDVAKKRLEQ